jgi:O-antigen biosynthesis protein WbqV
MQALIGGRRVLITGAGGSIGSELTRQIADLGPAHLTLVDQGEFNLYSVDLDISKGWPDLSVRPVIADVRDQARINLIFDEERPDLVLHAAALKHVPMVEENPIEGISTNAIGTQTIADACVRCKVAEMVLISTDKAVNPANTMGAGKRLAEIYCQAIDVKKHATRFITVRFGNVLGSAGSVLPLFQKQLADGGPLTITHPDIQRYFMTIGEAVELVLQAAALGPGKSEEGSIYVLDMGEPVKIVDLARQLIRLAGKIPDDEIKIKFVGLRPGEKLFEELFHGEEPLMPTGMGGIFLSQSRSIDSVSVISKFADLKSACVDQDSKVVFSILRELVPEFSGETNRDKLGTLNR